MTDLLEYGLRATTIWALLLAYYYLWGKRTSFRFQRLLLLGGWIFGLTIPLLPALESAPALPIVVLPGISLTKVVTTPITEVVTTQASWQWTDLLPWIYCTGVLVLTARALVQSWRTSQCLAEGKRSSFAGYPVITSSRVNSPFAARGYVFMPEGLSSDLTRTALLHETAHLRARHHYDKTLMTLSSILLWFHPLTWAYQRLLATVHEYEADAAVLQTLPARTYGLQLLQCHIRPAKSLGLFSSPLKQRIEMITQNPSPKHHWFSLAVLPVLLVLLIVSCSDLQERYVPTAESTVPVEESVSSSLASAELEDSMIAAVEEQYKAAKIEVITALYDAIRYPSAARASGTEGRFRADIRIKPDGSSEVVGVSNLSNLTVDNLPRPASGTTEIVTIGKGKAIQGATQDHARLREEVKRVATSLTNIALPKMPGDFSSSIVLGIDFVFKLED